LILAHAGIGIFLAKPWLKKLRLYYLLLGTLLPDLIDKFLFYVLPRFVDEVSLFITCTRTLGHTGLFLILFFMLALWFRSHRLLSVATGIGTHLVIDIVSDFYGPVHFFMFDQSSTARAFFYPLLGLQFGSIQWESLSEHVFFSFENPWNV